MNSEFIKSMCKCSLFIMITLLSISCTTTKYASLQQDYYNAMAGKTHNQIVSALGAPDRQTSDGQGGTILIYEEHSQQSIATAHNVNYYSGTYTPGVNTTTHTDYIHVYINSSGKCYNVKTNHIKSWQEQSTGKTVGLILGITLPLIGVGIAGVCAN